ncbi:MAG: class I SAM-dependent methyltransferase [Spirochaetota bacterium]|nr:class I SAM-dependent methyltransferase [Spirochaetota bacterium]
MNIVSSDYIPSNPLKRWRKRLLNKKGKKTKILDVGSGGVRIDSKAITMDIEASKGVDVVADAHVIPFKNNTFDTVWCEAVLEHVRDPNRVVSEIHRVLKRDGYIFAVVPFIHKYHAHPNDYQRYSKSGLEELFNKFKKEELGVYRGPTSALLSFITEYLTLFSNNKKLNSLIKGLSMLLLFPTKYLDKILIKNKRSHELSNALYYIGRKR